MKKPKLIRWLLFNVAIFCVVLTAVFTQDPGWHRVGLSAVWLLSAMSWGIAVTAMACWIISGLCDVKPTPAARLLPTPGWVDISVDLILAGIMMYHGWVWTALAWISHTAAGHVAIGIFSDISKGVNRKRA